MMGAHLCLSPQIGREEGRVEFLGIGIPEDDEGRSDRSNVEVLFICRPVSGVLEKL